ncbi:peptidoglycan-binding protein [Cellulomonas triticagri]|uniref:Peptidoglycan-binding protein n=1 Tax=Cellulomonas triticagri TaxID=2483352 RepID=A0A3M2IYH0_9CELL|nr:peptidoglycan-binding protein [Cellulomonas triticagri]RMI06912.1 peptidoglycan-binding protein [Cellulomonas triticagri]
MRAERWRRARPWVIVACVAVLACAAAFIIGTQVRSPWEEARQNANANVVASAGVIEGEILPEAVSLDGTISTGTVTPVVLDSPPGELKPVITRQRVSVGDLVRSGTPLVDVADRPVIALALPFPLYRDLFAGDTGSDVRAVQEALASLGLHPGQADGVLGARTQTAISELYRSVGAATPTPAQDDLTAVEEARAALQAAQAQVGEPTADGGDLARARVELQAAEARAAGWLPAREVFAIAGQATVTSAAAVGTVLNDGVPAVELRTGQPVALGRASLSVSDSFTVGAVVTVTGPGTTAPVAGTVSAASDFREASDTQPPGYEITVSLEYGEGLTEGGQVTVSLDNTDEPLRGTVVPLAAIRETEGGLAVLVLDTAPSQVPARSHEVEVSVRASRDGMALVEGDVRAGERVVVG